MNRPDKRHSSLFYGAFIACVVLMMYAIYIPFWVVINGKPTSLTDTLIAAVVNSVGVGLLTILIVEAFRWLRKV